MPAVAEQMSALGRSAKVLQRGAMVAGQVSNGGSSEVGIGTIVMCEDLCPLRRL